MNILGLQKLTLLDFPGRLAAIVFLGGCNFRCPFCQNSSLVLHPKQPDAISHEEFDAFLRKRSGILDGICITGGEPTLHRDLPELIRDIRAAGYLVKLDTNGTNPDMLEALLEEGLLDYVAMDIKAGRPHYAEVCGLPEEHASNLSSCSTKEKSCDMYTDMLSEESSGQCKTQIFTGFFEKISRSVELLRHSEIDYEFRTTVVRGLHDESDFADIAKWLSGAPKYYLQSFRDCPEVLQQGHSFSAFSKEEMLHFLSTLQKEIPQACLRES